MLDELGLGRWIRAARVRLRLRQIDVCSRAGVGRDALSALENGSGGRLRLGELDRIAAAVGLRLVVDLRAARGDLHRLGDAAHASLLESMATILRSAGWETSFEPTGGRGAIDLLAFHRASRMLLVVEVKSRLVDLQQTLRDLGYRVAAARTAAAQLGWEPRGVSRLLVIGASTTQRRIVRQHRSIFASAFPVRGREVREWIGSPREPISGLLFLPYVARPDVMQAASIRVRVAGTSASIRPGSDDQKGQITRPASTNGRDQASRNAPNPAGRG